MTTLLDECLRHLRTHVCEIEGTERREGDSHVLVLAPPSGGDYAFRLSSYQEDNLSIGAGLTVEQPGRDYFWHMPFELVAYSGRAELVESFWRTAATVLTMPTRVTQSRGWVFWKFRFEALDQGNWRKVYSMAGLRVGCAAPGIRGRVKVYHSGAVLRAACERPSKNCMQAAGVSWAVASIATGVRPPRLMRSASS